MIITSRGTNAKDLIQDENPALIILDNELPDFNRLAIIRALRADENYDRTGVILMGSNMHEEDVLPGLEVGADLCLLESFHPQDSWRGYARCYAALNLFEPTDLL